MDIIGDIFLARRHQCLDDRVTTALDVKGKVFRNLRTAVLVPYRQLRETGENIQPSDYPAIGLYGGYILLNEGYKV